MSLLPDLGTAVGGPLVAAPVSVSSPFDGLWLVQDGMSLANGISNGDWVEGGLGAFSLLLDGVAALVDPIGTLIGMGLSWVLEHIWPLNEYLNALTGNAGEVLRMSQTWANISTHLAGAGGDLTRFLADLESLEGAAIDAYRTFQADVAEHLALAGTLASATSTALEIASTIVKIVHDLTRDVISQIAGTAISAAITTAATVGFGAPVAIAQVAARVSALVPKVTKAIEAVIRSFERLAPLLAKVDEINAAIKRVLDRVVGGAAPSGPKPPSGGSGGGAPPGGSSAAAPPRNPVDGDDLSGSGWRRTTAAEEGAPRLEAGDGRPYPGYHGDSGTYPPTSSSNPHVQDTLNLVADPQAPYGRFPGGTPLTKQDYDVRYELPNGDPRYPPYDGAVPGTRVTYSDPATFVAHHGDAFDRVGSPYGEYLSVIENGTPASFEARGLPIDSLAKPYTGYGFTPDAVMRMTEDGIQIQVSRVAEAFGQPGGALQALFFRVENGTLVEMNVQDLLNAGYLR